MLQRKYRSIRVWAGLFMLALALIAGLALSASGAFAGVPASPIANPPVSKASGAPAQPAALNPMTGNYLSGATGAQTDPAKSSAKDNQSKSDKSVSSPKSAPSNNTSSTTGNLVAPLGVLTPPTYTVSSTTGATIVPGTTNIGSSCDDCNVQINIGFTYNLYGQPFTQVRVGSNGHLQFTSNVNGGSNDYTNVCLPATNTYNNVIFPYWSDQLTISTGTGCPAGGCGIFTSTSGSSPNRIFNIEWRSCAYDSGVCGAQLSYEARLYEANGRFDVIYAALDPADNGGFATVGVQFGAGTLFTQYECNTANSLSNGQQLAFNYDPGTDPTFTPLPTLTPTNTVSPTPTANCTPGSYAVASATATIEAGSTLLGGSQTDDGVTVLGAPFPVRFYGTSYSNITVGSNGNLQFASSSTSLTNACLPTTTFNTAIMPMWDDLDMRTTVTTTFVPGVYTSVTGSSPNRVLNIEWRACIYNSGACGLGTVNFEVRLFETSNNIEFIYGALSGATGTGSSATVGVQLGNAGVGGAFTQYSCNTASLASGMKLTFTYTPGTCPTGTPIPSPTITNTPTITFTPTPSFTLTVSPTPACPGAWTTQAVYPITILDEAVASQGGLLYSFGGVSNSALPTNAYKYDPIGNAWTAIAPLPAGREQASAVSDGTFIYILGGADSAGSNTTTIYRYDPSTDTYNTTLAPFTVATWAQAAAYLNGNIYKIAGCGTNCASFVNSVERYNIAGNSWTTVAPYPQTVGWLMATGMGSFVYAAGGVGTVSIANAYKYDPGTDTWTAIASMPATRWGSAEAIVKTRWMLAGGYVSDVISATSIQYDPVTDTWGAKDPMPQARSRMSGDSINFAMYAVGGRAVGDVTGFEGHNDNQKFFDLCQGPTLTPTYTATGTPPTSTPTRTPSNTPTRTSTPCGPNGNYLIATSTATIIPGVNLVAGSQTDDGVTTIALPFAYNLYTQTFTTVSVVTNGNMQFTSILNQWVNECLPTVTNAMNNLLAPHWDDLLLTASVCGAGCGIYTDTVGVSPNRIFVVEWRACIYNVGACAGNVNFEVLLYEGQNKFDYVYGVVTDNGGPHAASSDPGATIGVQRGTGPQRTQYSCNTASLSTGLRLTFTQNSCGPSGVINGHLTWSGVAAANRPNVTATLSICVSGTPVAYPFTTDTSSNFTIASGLADGTYSWQLKGGRHISTAGSLTISGGVATQEFGTQKGGNTNADNIVNATDFNALKTQFGQAGVKSADADYNLVVNASDFNIQKNSFGQAGVTMTCP